MKPTPEQIAKLPKWAQDHIKDLSSERDVSVRALNQYCDESKPSPFSVEDHICTGEQQGPSPKVRYIQAHTINVKWRGIELRLDANDYGGCGPGIRLQWNAFGSRTREVAMIPYSSQAVRLVAKDDMD